VQPEREVFLISSCKSLDATLTCFATACSPCLYHAQYLHAIVLQFLTAGAIGQMDRTTVL